MSTLKPDHESKVVDKPETPTEQLIRQTRQATQKRFTAEEKIRIVMEGIKGDEPVTVLCRREGIHSTMYYHWLKDFMEGGKARLKGEEIRGATRPEVKELQSEVDKLKQIVADLAVENLTLKKTLF
jgi:transposase